MIWLIGIFISSFKPKVYYYDSNYTNLDILITPYNQGKLINKYLNYGDIFENPQSKHTHIDYYYISKYLWFKQSK